MLTDLQIRQSVLLVICEKVCVCVTCAFKLELVTSLIPAPIDICTCLLLCDNVTLVAT